MEVLILGGTAWLGREVARAALARGHAVTCLARGRSGPAEAGARLVVGDRDSPDAYDAVVDRRWDVVLDVASQPGHVRRAVTALQPVAAQFCLVSTGNVYADLRPAGRSEDQALLAPLASDGLESVEQYGAAKVACEEAVLAGFGSDRALIARAGLLGGPGDRSGRSGYWPWRFAHPAHPERIVLVPDAPQAPTALLDARDLAAWLVDGAERRTTGVFNVAGDPLPLAEHLSTARTAAGHRGGMVAAPPDWLAGQGVQAWMGPTSLPMWLDDPDWYGINTMSTARARAAGLETRPLARTLADALAWEEQGTTPPPHGAGLTDDEERRLLGLLAVRDRT